MERDPYAGRWRRIREAALDGPGSLTSERRRLIAAHVAQEPGGRPDPDERLARYVETLARHAYRTTDDEVATLARAVSEDAVLEATVAAALGAAQQRLDAALALLAEPPG